MLKGLFMNRRPWPFPRRTAGFSLLEVLIALMILSVGLLGLAGLQAFSVQNTHHAYLRTQAVLAAYDMADRMRANIKGVQAGSYDGATSASPPSDPGCITSAGGCGPSQLAAHDIRHWSMDVLTCGTCLPSGAGAVANNGDGTFNVNVSWSEREKNSTSGAASHSFLLVFRP